MRGKPQIIKAGCEIMSIKQRWRIQKKGEAVKKQQRHQLILSSQVHRRREINQGRQARDKAGKQGCEIMSIFRRRR